MTHPTHTPTALCPTWTAPLAHIGLRTPADYDAVEQIEVTLVQITEHLIIARAMIEDTRAGRYTGPIDARLALVEQGLTHLLRASGTL